MPVVKTINEEKHCYEVVGRITKTNFTEILLVDLAEGKGELSQLVYQQYAVSDSIGETSEAVTKATISQFVQEKFDIIRVPYLRCRASSYYCQGG